MSEQQPPAPGTQPGGGRRRSRRGGRRSGGQRPNPLRPGGEVSPPAAAGAVAGAAATASGMGPGVPSGRSRRRGRGGSGNRGTAGGRQPQPPPREAELSDQVALERLREAGFVLEAVHELEAFIYFPNEANARRVIPLLEAAGYTSYPEPTGDGRWVIEAVIRAAPLPEYIAAMRRQLRGFAAPLGGLYDGWSATPIDAEAEAEAARLGASSPPELSSPDG